MNGKHLLIAAFATTFSGINLVASTEITIETIIPKIKAYKAITDKKIRRRCRELNSDLCQELDLLMAATDNIDFGRISTLAQLIEEEIKNNSIANSIEENGTSKNNEEDAASDNQKIIDDIITDNLAK